MFSLFYQSLTDEEEIGNEKIVRKEIRAKTNLLLIADQFFLQNFRVSKETFLHILDAIRPHVNADNLNGISLEEKLAACLRFFAEGKYQHGVGKDYNIAIAKSTFSKVLTEMLPILEKVLCTDWISLNMTEEEKHEAKLYFYEKSGIHDVVMCVDGTHVRIKKPSIRPLRFCNRKKNYSLNVMIVCDNKNRIRAVDARYPGSNHDAHVWRMSLVKEEFQKWHQNGERLKILGDSGYPTEPWLI